MPVTLKSSGGGSVTMDVPSTASTYTLTLPAATGTVLQSGTTVTVAQGGTGLATLTANNVILGNGTGTPNFVAPGTSGNVLTSNGTTWTSAAAAASGFSNMQVFTSTGTFTVPAGITKVKVTVVGGGGGTTNNGSSGGGGGGSAIKIISGLTPGGTVAVTVGAGGSGNTASTGVAGTGGTSSFGAYCSATGGTGASGRDNANALYPGSGGLGSSGDINLKGGPGTFAISDPLGIAAGMGGIGGGTILGSGSRGALFGGSNIAAESNAYGCGAGGSWNSTGLITGLAGAAGVVIVEY